MVFKNCLGTIMSVSTLIMGIGAALARKVVNGSMAAEASGGDDAEQGAKVRSPGFYALGQAQTGRSGRKAARELCRTPASEVAAEPGRPQHRVRNGPKDQIRSPASSRLKPFCSSAAR